MGKLARNGLKSKSLARYHVQPKLKTVTMTFLEKVKYKSTTSQCATDVAHSFFTFNDNQITKT